MNYSQKPPPLLQDAAEVRRGPETLERECFGFVPSRPLKSLIIQGENDDGDIAEMRAGVVAGLKLSEVDQSKVSANVLCLRCNSATGQKFVQRVARRDHTASTTKGK